MTLSAHFSEAPAALDLKVRGTRPDVLAAWNRPFADPGRLLVETLDAIEDGLVVTDARCTVLHTNRAARTIIAAGLLTQKNGILCAGTPQATRTLQDAIAGQDAARTPVVLWLGSPCARQLLSVTVSSGKEPAGPCGQTSPVVVVSIRRATPTRLPSVETMQATFDLTPAEAKMAHEVLKGDGVTACARRLGVTTNTARTHLNRVFDKTGTRRQAELVGLLLGCRG